MPRKFDDDRDDDDDDRPRKRRNRDDDDADEEDDRPRRRRSSRPAPKSNTKLILGIVGGVFFAFFLVCGGIGFMMFRSVKKGLDQVQAGTQSMQQSNNLKQIGMGMFNVADAGTGLVGPYTIDKSGKVQQGLSFRVGLLPYVEQDMLYRRFDLTKAWDAPENAAAARTFVMTYAGPNALGQNDQTPFRVFYGGGALFEADGKPVNFSKITDGSSNTIMLVTAVETVPWAKPQEFAYSKTTPLPPLALNGGTVKYLLLMADGSTRFVTPAISVTVLRQAIEKADGTVINWPFE